MSGNYMPRGVSFVERGIPNQMPTKSDVITEQLDEIRQDLRHLWIALTTDPKKQKRKERAWSLVSGALAAAATLGARQAATKIWTRLTGEMPPPLQEAQKEAAKVEREASS
jgi:hypothetical protein